MTIIGQLRSRSCAEHEDSTIERQRRAATRMCFGEFLSVVVHETYAAPPHTWNPRHIWGGSENRNDAHCASCNARYGDTIGPLTAACHGPTKENS